MVKMAAALALTAALLLAGSGTRVHAAAAGSQNPDPPSCRTVRFSDVGWTDVTSTTALTAELLRSIGYQPTITVLSVPVTFASLKNGDIDVFLGNWMPAQAPLVKPFEDDKSIEVVHPNLSNAKFTLAVPDYVAAAGVHSFADLAKNADKFDSKIYGIEPGAPANQNIKKMVDDKAYGLGNWKLVESSETGMLTQVERAVRDKKWIVFLAWEPHLMNTKFKLTYLDGGDKYFGPNYGGATVNTVARNGYAEQCPNVGRLFRQLTFNVDLENGVITEVLEKKTGVDAAATEALKRHPELLKSWLDGVNTVNGANGLQAVQAALGVK